MSEEKKEQLSQQEQLERALKALEGFVHSLAEQAGCEASYADRLWQGIVKSEGVLKELAYYYDTGDFWCGYRVGDFTLADILIWQVDHFKAYMDRHEEMNRYRRERLFLESLEVMLEMEKDPAKYAEKMRCESGTDRENPF